MTDQSILQDNDRPMDINVRQRKEWMHSHPNRPFFVMFTPAGFILCRYSRQKVLQQCGSDRLLPQTVRSLWLHHQTGTKHLSSKSTSQTISNSVRLAIFTPWFDFYFFRPSSSSRTFMCIAQEKGFLIPYAIRNPILSDDDLRNDAIAGGVWCSMKTMGRGNSESLWILKPRSTIMN